MPRANTSWETQQSWPTFMSLTASATSLRSTVADSRILARASEILMMLSSCLGVAEITCTSRKYLQIFQRTGLLCHARARSKKLRRAALLVGASQRPQ